VFDGWRGFGALGFEVEVLRWEMGESTIWGIDGDCRDVTHRLVGQVGRRRELVG